MHADSDTHAPPLNLTYPQLSNLSHHWFTNANTCPTPIVMNGHTPLTSSRTYTLSAAIGHQHIHMSHPQPNITSPTQSHRHWSRKHAHVPPPT